MKFKYYSWLSIIVLIVTFLSNCKKDESAKPDNMPKIITKAATVYPDGGVTLTAEMSAIPPDLTEYGFLLSKDSLFAYPQKYNLKNPATTGTFNLDVPIGLQKNTKYFVAAYSVGNTSGIIRYNVVSFNSSGSKKPVVGSVSPLKADLGDTITIRGKYFDGQYTEVVFGDRVAKTTQLNDSTIKCLVPIELAQAAPVIGIRYSGITDTISANFSLNTPVITSFTALATFRDTITITGDHFGYLNSLNQVSIGNTIATVVNSTRKEIKVLVPDDVQHSFNDVSLKAQLQTVATPMKFQIRPPVITSITASGNIPDPVTVKGENFHPVPSRNAVYSENIATQINGGTTTQLNYNIPNGAYPRRKAKITLRLLDYTVTYNIDMIIKNKWVIIGTVPFTGSPGAFTINNTSYVIGPTKDIYNRQLYLWKFNPADYSWQQIDIPFKVDNAQVTASGSKAYFYAISPNASFYEFYPSSNTWTRKADYPAAVRRGGTMFTIGTKTYLGLGSSSKTLGIDDTDDSFYEYASTTNTWRRVADYPDKPDYGRRGGATAFIINNIAYVGGGANNTGMVAFYSYSPGSNAWTKIHDFPDARFGATAFAIGNKGFISNGQAVLSSSSKECFRYDPTSDTWLKLKDPIGCEICGDDGTVAGYAFINNGKVYVGGDNHYYYLYETAASGL